jgi:hypothetical protein
MESTTETLKTSFPTLVVPLAALEKNNKNILFEWLKSRIGKLNDQQCSDLMTRCADLMRKPADGQAHVGTLDSKWKIVAEFHSGELLINVTSDVKGDSEFKLMLQVVAVLPHDLLSQCIKDVVDFLPKAKVPDSVS